MIPIAQSFGVNEATTALAVIGVYLFIIFGIAVWSYSKTDLGHLEDFFLMDRNLGPIVGVLTIFATFQSGYFMLGNVGFFYLFGYPWILGSLATSPLVGILIWYFGSRFWIWSKEYGHISIARMIGHYYESVRLRGLVSVVTALFLIPYIGAQLIAAGVALNGITSGLVTYEAGVVFMTVVILLYTIIGGFRAVTLSDAIQGGFFFVVMWLISFYFFARFGGVGGFFESLSTEYPNALTFQGLTGADVMVLHVGLFIAVVLGFMFQPYIFQRVIAARDLKTVKNMSVWTGVIVLVGYLATMVVGLGILQVMPGIENSDDALPVFLSEFFPLLGSVVIASAIAAMMSTSDSHLITAAATAVDDFYRPFFDENPSPTVVKYVSWGIMLLLMVASFLIALLQPDFIVDITILAYAGFVPLLWAGLGMILWRRATAAGVFASLIVGSLIVLLQYMGFIPFVPELGNFDYAIVSFPVSAVAFVVVSLLTEPPSEETREEYHQLVDDYM